MNIFFWKKNNAIDIFANELSNELFSIVSPLDAEKLFIQELSDDKKTIKIAKKMRQQIQGVITKVNQFKIINSLGVYGKARLHLKFKVRLEELGYEAAIVDKMNRLIMLETS